MRLLYALLLLGASLSGSEKYVLSFISGSHVPSLRVNESKEVGYDYLNALRAKAGMIPLRKDFYLQKSAQNHALYLVSNNMVGHYETLLEPTLRERLQLTGL